MGPRGLAAIVAGTAGRVGFTGGADAGVDGFLAGMVIPFCDDFFYPRPTTVVVGGIFRLGAMFLGVAMEGASREGWRAAARARRRPAQMRCNPAMARLVCFTKQYKSLQQNQCFP